MKIELPHTEISEITILTGNSQKVREEAKNLHTSMDMLVLFFPEVKVETYLLESLVHVLGEVEQLDEFKNILKLYKGRVAIATNCTNFIYLCRLLVKQSRGTIKTEIIYL